MDEKKLKELILQNESEILEFKQNNEDPERIGKYLSISKPICSIRKTVLIYDLGCH